MKKNIVRSHHFYGKMEELIPEIKVLFWPKLFLNISHVLLISVAFVDALCLNSNLYLLGSKKLTEILAKSTKENCQQCASYCLHVTLSTFVRFCFSARAGWLMFTVQSNPIGGKWYCPDQSVVCGTLPLIGTGCGYWGTSPQELRVSD